MNHSKSQPSNHPCFLTVLELADLLRVKPRTIYEMVAQRKIPFRKAGRRTIFLLDEILQWTKRAVYHLTAIGKRTEGHVPWVRSFQKAANRKKGAFMAVRKRGEVWHLDLKIDGIRYRQSCPEATNKKQALQAEAKLRQAIFDGKYNKRRTVARFADFIDQTYLPWSKANKKSWQSDVWRTRMLKRYFGKKSLMEITPAEVEQFKTTRKNGITQRGQQRSKASVQREWELLSGIFTMAMHHDLVEANPLQKVRKFKLDNQRVRYLTAEEETRLMKALEYRRDYLRSVIILALNTGMRRGEILSLEWKQVDFLQNNLIVTKTKTDRMRYLPMNDRVREELLSLQTAGQSQSPYVFESPRKPGTPLGEIKKGFKALLQKAEIEDFHFHDFRHTAATRLAEAGADAYLIAEILGHSNVQMSFRYTHMTNKRKRHALDKLAGYSAQLGHI